MKIYIMIILFCVEVLALLNPPMIISLVPPGGYEVLEMENQIDRLCPEKDLNLKEKCKAEKLKEKKWDIDIYEQADLKAKKMGVITIKVIPGKGIQAQIETQDKKNFDLLSETENSDWGYGSYFQFTVSAVKGDWVQLPKKGLMPAFWFNLKHQWGSDKSTEIIPQPELLAADMVYDSKKHGSIYIIKFQGNNLIYREENENDMLCGEEQKKIDPEKLKEFTKPIEEFYNEEGRLNLWIKYSKGC